tara:strand:+ start:214 stop:432 length:219 start_codon:yes stop_codon:yes gene_type:complete
MRLWSQMWERIVGLVRRATLLGEQRKVLNGVQETIAKDSADSDIDKDDYERDIDIIENVDRVVPFLKKSQDE